MTAGQRIKAARKKAGLTQSELANKLNIPYQSIGQWENDLRNPKKETLQKIAAALGVPVSQLLGFSEIDVLRDQIEKNSSQISQDITKDIIEKLQSEQPLLMDLMDAFNKLNDEGQQKAVERIEELTEIPKYQKN